jgi:hypothetical protein
LINDHNWYLTRFHISISYNNVYYNNSIIKSYHKIPPYNKQRSWWKYVSWFVNDRFIPPDIKVSFFILSLSFFTMSSVDKKIDHIFVRNTFLFACDKRRLPDNHTHWTFLSHFQLYVFHWDSSSLPYLCVMFPRLSRFLTCQNDVIDAGQTKRMLIFTPSYRLFRTMKIEQLLQFSDNSNSVQSMVTNNKTIQQTVIHLIPMISMNQIRIPFWNFVRADIANLARCMLIPATPISSGLRSSHTVESHSLNILI